jgi:hypothetical protein
VDEMGSVDHSTELEELEAATVFPDSFLQEEGRSGGHAGDPDRGEHDDREGDQQPERREDDVERAFAGMPRRGDAASGRYDDARACRAVPDRRPILDLW